MELERRQWAQIEQKKLEEERRIRQETDREMARVRAAARQL